MQKLSRVFLCVGSCKVYYFINDSMVNLMMRLLLCKIKSIVTVSGVFLHQNTAKYISIWNGVSLWGTDY